MSNILKYQNPSSPLLVPRDTSNVDFNKFLMTLPDNQRLTPEEDYHTYHYWLLNGRPKNFKQAKRRGMYHYDKSDSAYHAQSVAFDENGVGWFMKPKHHPTVKYELDWFNNGLETLEGGIQRPLVGKDREEWEDFTKRYQLDTSGVDYRYVPIQKKGGRIHIKKKNRGKFTAAAKRAGMGVQEFAKHVLANKDKYSSTLVKRANFARNAKKFKHENGGILKAQFGLSMINPFVVQHQLKNRVAPVINEHGKQIDPPSFKHSSGARLAARDRAMLMWSHGDRLADKYQDHLKLVMEQSEKNWYEHPVNNRTNAQKAAELSLLGQGLNLAGPWGVAAARIASIPDQVYDWAASIAEPTNVRNHVHTGANYLDKLAKITPTKYDDYVAKAGELIGNVDDAVSSTGHDLFDWSKKKKE